ncbi:MAG: hypothetical protein KAS23_11540 [Anaerohalosphaera sp.]|nr:hypothetical protein [Anaerohalosphaera sp.]
MTSQNDTWISLKKNYITQVEKALSGISHPKKKDVLADVTSHLDQRYAELAEDQKTHQALEEIITEMGPASDYAELLEPEAKQRKKILPLLVACSLLVAALLIIAANVSNHPKYGAKLRELFNRNFTANPFFSISNFEKIEPGMTETQVRDLIGYPMIRRQIAHNPNASPEQIAIRKDEIHWDYTEPAFNGADYYQSCRVTLSKNTGTVLRTSLHRSSYANGSTTNPAYALFPLKVGSLEVKTFDNKTLQLTSTDSQISIVIIGGRNSISDMKPEWLDKYHQQAQTLLDSVQARDISVYYIKRDMRERIVGSRDFDFDYVIYKKGNIYSLPTLYASLDEQVNDSYQQDRRWLIKRLMKE